MKIEINCQPTEIQEGMQVTLTASAPAKISDCKWRVKGPLGEDVLKIQPLEPDVTDVIVWDTTGLPSGHYTIHVKAKVAGRGSAGATESAGDIDVNVLPRSVSSQDVERLAKGAKEFAQHLKYNLDSKMDNLTGEVSKVATGVGVLANQASGSGQPLKVVLQRSATLQTPDQALWPAIRHHTEMIGFNRYSEFINRVLCVGSDQDGPLASGALDLGAPTLGERRDDLISRPTIHGVDAYELLRTATEVFLILECGIGIRHGELLNLAEEESRLGARPTLADITGRLQQYLGPTQALPYLTRIVNALFGFDPARRDGNFLTATGFSESASPARA